MVGKVPTASTAVTIIGEKALQNTEVHTAICDRFRGWRSMRACPRVTMTCDIARSVCPYMGVLRTVRAMRSVLYSAYQARSPPYRDLLTIQASSKPP